MSTATKQNIVAIVCIAIILLAIVGLSTIIGVKTGFLIVSLPGDTIDLIYSNPEWLDLSKTATIAIYQKNEDVCVFAIDADHRILFHQGRFASPVTEADPWGDGRMKDIERRVLAQVIKK